MISCGPQQRPELPNGSHNMRPATFSSFMIRAPRCSVSFLQYFCYIQQSSDSRDQSCLNVPLNACNHAQYNGMNMAYHCCNGSTLQTNYTFRATATRGSRGHVCVCIHNALAGLRESLLSTRCVGATKEGRQMMAMDTDRAGLCRYCT